MRGHSCRERDPFCRSARFLALFAFNRSSLRKLLNSGRFPQRLNAASLAPHVKRKFPDRLIEEVFIFSCIYTRPLCKYGNDIVPLTNESFIHMQIIRKQVIPSPVKQIFSFILIS